MKDQRQDDEDVLSSSSHQRHEDEDAGVRVSASQEDSRELLEQSISPEDAEHETVDDVGNNSNNHKHNSSTSLALASRNLNRLHSSFHEITNMPLYLAPRQRQRWGEKQLHPHTNYGDTFFDLFYVAAAYNLGNLLREDPTPRGLFYLCGLFFTIMMCWQQKLFYDSRFSVQDDVFHRIYEVALLIALSTSVLHIRTVAILSDLEHHRDLFVFCLGIVVSQVLSFGRCLEVYLCSRPRLLSGDSNTGLYPEAHAGVTPMLGVEILPFFFMVAAAIYSGIQYNNNSNTSSEVDYTSSNSSSTSSPSYSYDDVPQKQEITDDDRLRWLAADEEASSGATASTSGDDTVIWLLLAAFFSWLLAYGFTVFVVFGSWRKLDRSKLTVPLNVQYCIHRYGEWAMLVMGESVLSLLIVEIAGYQYYFTFTCGIVTSILLQYLHFRSQPSDPDSHALRRDRVAGFAFGQIFCVYAASLLILGASYKMMLFEHVYYEDDQDSSSASSSHRNLSPLFRLLAGSGESAALRFDTQDRYQRIAYFFSFSLAIIFFCLDTMSLGHVGINATIERIMNGKLTWKGRSLLAFVTTARVGIIGFIATVSLYETRPPYLALIGMCSVLAQIIVRYLGATLFPPSEAEEEERRTTLSTVYAAASLYGREHESLVLH